MQDIEAKLVLTQEDIAYIWNGGTLAVKIDGPDVKVSLDLSCSRSTGAGGETAECTHQAGTGQASANPLVHAGRSPLAV
jgi:hypothetical protein